jgi:PAS domain S-box-containing protein
MAAATVDTPSKTSMIKNISLQLQWKDQFQFAGFYMAKEKGFYRDVDLNVTFKAFDFSKNVVEEVINRQADFGVGRSSLIASRANGKNIVLIAPIFQLSPLVLAVKESSSIHTLSDLKNRRISLSGTGQYASINAMLRSKKLSDQDLSSIQVSNKVESLIQNEVDCISIYTTNQGYNLSKRNIPLRIFNPKDYGFEFYGDTLFTGETFAKNNPQIVKKFKEASLKGWEYAFEHIEESVDFIFTHYNSQNKTKEALLYEAKELKKLAYYKTDKLGKLDPTKVQRIYDIYNVMGLVKNPIQLHSLLFNSTISFKHFTPEELTYINQAPPIQVAMLNNFKPFSFEKENTIMGLSVDILHKISQISGLTFEIVPSRWSKALRRFKNRQIPMIADISHTQERESFTLFTPAYHQIPTFVFGLEKDAYYKGIDSLKGKKVGISQDIFYKKEFIQKGIAIKEYGSSQEKAHALAIGEINYFTSSYTSGLKAIESQSLTNIKPLAQLDNIKKEDLRFGIAPTHTLLHSIITKSLGAIKEKEFEQLIQHWIVNNRTQPFIQTSTIQTTHSDALPLTFEEKKYLQNKQTIYSCFPPNFFPIDALKDGKETGIMGDINRMIAQKLNVKIEPILIDKTTDIFKACDVFSLVSKEYSSFKMFLPTDVITDGYFALITTLDKLYVLDSTEIKGKRVLISAMAHKKHIEAMYPYLNIELEPNTNKALQAVKEGKAYGYITLNETSDYLIQKFGFGELKVSGHFCENNPVKASIGVLANKPILLSIYNKALRTIPKGRVAEIKKRWRPIQYHKEVDYTLVYQIVSLFTFLSLIGIIILVILNNSNRKLKQLINATIEGMLIFKEDRCIEANHQAASIFGYDSFEELKETNISEILPAESKELFYHHLNSSDKPYEINMTKKDFSPFPTLVKTKYINSKEKIFIISIMDLTEIKEKDRMLLQQSKLASLGEMIENIAHQWRQPLSTISTVASGLKMQKEMGMETSQEEDINLLKRLNESAQFLSKTIDDFRSFFKPNKKRVYFKLQHIYEKTLSIISSKIKKNEIEVIENIEEIELYGLDGELMQVFINLLNNAQDALMSSEVERKLIFVDMYKEDDHHVIIKVKDNAGGIKKEAIDRVFEPYFTTKHQSQGTGIGLYMSQEIIVKHMLGSIDAINETYTYENESYTGANFIIRLPFEE